MICEKEYLKSKIWCMLVLWPENSLYWEHIILSNDTCYQLLNTFSLWNIPLFNSNSNSLRRILFSFTHNEIGDQSRQSFSKIMHLSKEAANVSVLFPVCYIVPQASWCPIFLLILKSSWRSSVTALKKSLYKNR